MKSITLAALAAAGILGVSIPAAAASGGFGMLRSVDKGLWQVKYRESGKSEKLCVKSGLELLQVGNPPKGCRRFVVQDASGAVDVQLTCPGQGYARTLMRRETPSLLQVEAQGIRNGMPYAMRGEARRTGSC